MPKFFKSNYFPEPSPAEWRSFRDEVKEQIDLREEFAPLLRKVRYSHDYIMGCCPFHVDRNPSLMVTATQYKCYGCGAQGDVFTWYEAPEGRGLSMSDTLRGLSRLCGVPLPGDRGLRAAPKTPPQPLIKVPSASAGKAQAWPRNAIARVLAQSVPCTHPSAEPARNYLLLTRGLSPITIPHALRFHPALPYRYLNEDGEYVLIDVLPTILALVTAPDGQLASLLRIAVSHGGKKAVPTYKGDALPVRRLMTAITPGATMGAAVRLFEPGPVLAVAEGVETALAYHQLSGLPTWSCISTGGLERVIIPDNVEEVVIAADRDANEAGQKAAIKLAERLKAEGRRFRVDLPPDLGHHGKTDFNDVLLREGI